MDFLTSIPIWVYFIIIALTYMVTHVLSVKRDVINSRRRSLLGRIGSTIVLLLALVFFDPAAPGTVLIALLVAAIAGVISGRTARLPVRE